WSPPLGLDVVNVGVLSRLDGCNDLPDVDAVLDDRVAHVHVAQGNLVSERNVLGARQAGGAVLVENQSGQCLSGLDAFDDDDGNGILGVVQYAVNHRREFAADWGNVSSLRGAHVGVNDGSNPQVDAAQQEFLNDRRKCALCSSLMLASAARGR